MMDGEITEERKKQLDRAVDEFHLFAARMREVYGFDAVAVLASFDNGEFPEKCCARSGNLYVARHMARLYSNDKFGDVEE